MLTWRETYLPLFNSDRGHQLKKLTLQDAVSTASVSLSPKEMKEFSNIVSRLRKILDDPVLYKLMLLIVLTQPDSNENEWSALSRLHTQLLMLLKRRLSWETSTIVYNDVMNAVQELSNLTGMLEKVWREASQLPFTTNQ